MTMLREMCELLQGQNHNPTLWEQLNVAQTQSKMRGDTLRLYEHNEC